VRHIYIHAPFCSRRCSYCDFSIAVRRDVPTAAFAASVGAELRRRITNLVSTQLTDVETLYIGGGTPSKLGAPGIRQLFAELTAPGVRLAPGAEFTIEANPEDINPAAAAAWLEAGVNRLSVGVQSFDPEVLAWMHRTHTADEAAAAVRAARSAGFTDISVDLIYALPERLNRDWDADLSRALELAPEHLSLYGLTVEPHTPLGRWTARGAEVPAADDRAADQFLHAHERLASAGFEHYEVSNYARPSHRSRHNSSYWKRVPYLGLGPSAHSFDGATRRWNIAALAEWERALAAGNDPVGGAEGLDDSQVASELLYLGLRSDSGVQLTGINRERAAAWVREGWAVQTPPQERGVAGSAAGDGIVTRLTPEGWLRLDALVASLQL
jgi:oxygen-independent coproporphyrinogen-3 oxidase